MPMRRQRSFKGNRKKNKKNTGGIISRTVISLLSLIVILFIFSFFHEIVFPPVHVSENINLEDLIQRNAFEESTGERIEVMVYNGCGQKGLAKLYTEFLRAEGFDVIDSDNADRFDYEKSQIVVTRNDYKKGTFLAAIMGIDTKDIVIDNASDVFYDLELLIGIDYRELSSYSNAIQHYSVVH